MRHRGLWVGGGVVFLVLATLGAEVMIVERRTRMVWRAQDRVCGMGRLVAVRAISFEERPLALPKGDIWDLCEWAEGRIGTQHSWRALMPSLRREQVVDPWGRPLVYRFPASAKERLFDLYSTGPNGVDEMGSGDDITCGPDADFGSWLQYFKGGIIDVDWVRAHLDDLKRDRHGKITGAPPEKLKDIE